MKTILDEHVTLSVECLDRLCLNGHEWAKGQLGQEGMALEALDNGFWRCANPTRLQTLCDPLGPEHIQAFLDRWLGRLPFPLEGADRQAGYSPQLSIGQMEYSLTHLKQILRPIHPRLLEGERTRPNCRFSPQSLQRLIEPSVTPDGQKAPGLKFGQPPVMALFLALGLFLTLPAGFRNRQLRQHVAALLGRELEDYTPGQMTYDLRRLRLKGLICRRPGTSRYERTPYGRNTRLFLARLYQRVFRPGLAAAVEPPCKVEVPHPLRDKLREVNEQIDLRLQETHRLN